MTKETDEDKEMDNLSETELIRLAMQAFLHMNMDKDISKEELLKSILLWFDVMTFDSRPIGGRKFTHSISEYEH